MGRAVAWYKSGLIGAGIILGQRILIIIAAQRDAKDDRDQQQRQYPCRRGRSFLDHGNFLLDHDNRTTGERRRREERRSKNTGNEFLHANSPLVRLGWAQACHQSVTSLNGAIQF